MKTLSSLVNEILCHHKIYLVFVYARLVRVQEVPRHDVQAVIQTTAVFTALLITSQPSYNHS